MKTLVGMIRRDEAYSKTTLMKRLGIGQPFWQKMISDGLAFVQVGHSRWVTGEALFQWFEKQKQCDDFAGV